ncbi:Nadph-dependent 1-acyldihydroxyacetone phosphate reductase [Mycena venus]|uniref:Nadph-dependent 1-acyldihydroxyacetone phosphate reductase n=1 Tax=Mycena venus TaxID=2733690 RepID=A0A8H7CQ14_9AGAR|nr:Nadph-dependent 1-acyldihydroxyacetone phosphate reductase [Mycena venus]
MAPADNPSPKRKTMLITGCSAGGVGAALATALACRDPSHHVFATARTTAKIPAALAALPNVTVLPLDVASSASVRACAQEVARILEAELPGAAGLDVLVNNAGAGLTMPLLDTDVDEAARLHDVNLWGALRTVQAFADLIIAARGKVVNVSSVGSVANMAWNGQSSSRREKRSGLELAPFGVSVLTVMLGGVATAFIANEAPRPLPPGSRYASIGDAILLWAREKGGLAGMMSPERLAEELVPDILASGKSGTVWRGSSAGLVRFVAGWLPQAVMDRFMAVGGLDRLAKS